MTAKLSSPPDPFSLSPLLALLPEEGSATRLNGLATSLFARHESVVALRERSDNKEIERRCLVEGLMLRQVLDWLEMRQVGE